MLINNSDVSGFSYKCIILALQLDFLLPAITISHILLIISHSTYYLISHILLILLHST